MRVVDFSGTRVGAAVRSAATLLLAVLMMMIMAPSASAHARLVSTTPEQGAVLAAAPATVVLTFTEGVRLGPDAVHVAGPGGRIVDLPTEPTSVDRVVTIALPTGLPHGGYEVSWRAVSDDSHPLSGVLAFTLATATATEGVAPDTPFTTDPDDRPAAVPADGSTVIVLYGIVRALAYAAFALLVGSVAFVLLCWPAGRTVGWVRRTWRSGAVGLAVATVAALLLQGAYGSGGGLLAVLDPAAVTSTLSLPLGIALLARLILLVGVAVFLRIALARPATPALRWTGAGLAVGLALTWSTSGHASTGPQPVLAIPIDAAHLVAMGVWLGGLVVVAGLCRTAEHVPAVDVLNALRRFSALAFGSVLVLVTTGSYAAVQQVGSLDALVGTAYGRLLLAKIAVVTLTVALAWASRQWAMRLRLPAETAPWPVAPGRDRGGTITAPSRRTERRAALVVASGVPGLRRSVLVEVAAATLVLGVTAALVTVEPARTAVAAAAPAATPVAAAAEPASGPYVTEEIGFGGGADGPAGTLRVGVEPARVGTNTVIVLLTDTAGVPVDLSGLQASLALPAAGITGLPAPLAYIDIGHHHGDVRFPAAGRWELTLTVQTGAASTATVIAPIVIEGGT